MFWCDCKMRLIISPILQSHQNKVRTQVFEYLCTYISVICSQILQPYQNKVRAQVFGSFKYFFTYDYSPNPLTLGQLSNTCVHTFLSFFTQSTDLRPCMYICAATTVGVELHEVPCWGKFQWAHIYYIIYGMWQYNVIVSFRFVFVYTERWNHLNRRSILSVCLAAF